MLDLGSRDLSPHAINQETELRAVYPRELIISSIGKKAWILLLEQSENKLGATSTHPSPCSLRGLFYRIY